MAGTAKASKARRGGVVRVDAETQSVLDDLSKATGEAKKQLVARSVQLMKNQRILDVVCEAYRQIRADPAAWAEEKAERRDWEATNLDGLDDD